MAASRKELGALHALLADTLAAEIRKGDPQPAMLSVVRAFLKDSGIEVSSDYPTASMEDLKASFDEFADSEIPDFSN
jgi:hypothetical protein